MPKPYYREDGVTIYCGDAREICKHIEQPEAVITDPVWPNCEHVFPGVDAKGVLRETLWPLWDVKRVVIHLGNTSDPRFLEAVWDRWKFFRTCYLEFALVGYLGRVLRDAEVAYAFGAPPDSKPGQRVIPGRCIATRSETSKGWGNKARTPEIVAAAVARLAHPAPRKLEHVRWLVKWFGGASVLDPFGGTGTTAVACKALGIPCTLIEIEEKYCEIAASRLAQGTLELCEVSA